MITEVIRVSIDGRPQDALVPDILYLEVEEDLEQATAFRLQLAITLRSNGSWTYVDDPPLRIWRRFVLKAGYPGATETLVDGYITHVELMIGAEDEPYLEISGMDLSAKMDLAEKQLAWPNKKDHEIAKEIFSSYGLRPEIEDTVATHADKVATILQTETDIRFLRRLAARNGFECHVRGNTGYFRSPNLQGPPQKTLAIEFGRDTNLAEIRIRIDGTPATVAEIRRVDPIAKRVEGERLAASPRRTLGRRPLAQLRSGLPDGQRLLRREIAVAPAEMRGRLRQAYEDASRFVTAEGEIDGRVYRAVLRARRLVTIKGIGETYSGLYYVRRVRHSFAVGGYTQQFEAYRNGLGLTGDERFAAAALPFAVAVGLAGVSRPTGNGVLPAQPAGATSGGG
jgi:phage protein D